MDPDMDPDTDSKRVKQGTDSISNSNSRRARLMIRVAFPIKIVADGFTSLAVWELAKRGNLYWLINYWENFRSFSGSPEYFMQHLKRKKIVSKPLPDDLFTARIKNQIGLLIGFACIVLKSAFSNSP